jgi:hypothetical protein
MFLAFLFVFNLYAQVDSISREESKENIKNLREEILKEIKGFKLNEENFSAFSDIMSSLRQKSTEYTEAKNQFCIGKFSTISIDENGIEKEEKKKLTPEERKACLSQLKNYVVQFTNGLFGMRKQYLERLHKDNIASLEQARLDVIADLEKKYNQSSKRRSKPRKKR